MLVAKGYRAVFEMEDGSIIRAPGGAALLHDESGRDWPEQSGLVMSFARTGGKLTQPPRSVRSYFGDGYPISRGRVALPPRSLTGWRELGRVKRATYFRRGNDFFGSPTDDGDQHVFGERTMFGLMGGAPLPTLYERGNAMRIELGRGCKWDHRGFVG